VNVLQTLTTDAELAALSGHSAINVTSALGLANVASASLSFTAIQPPQVAYGPVGTTVNTGQVQLTLTLTLTSGAVITIGPITGGNGTASITSITCANTNTEYLTKMTASTTAASAAVTAVGLGATTLTINGVSGVSVTFGTNVVPPNVNSVQLRTNPIYVTLSSPTFSYSGAALTGTTGTVLTALGTALPPVLQALGMTVANAQMAELSASCTDVALVR
jgi:hypothetical protein